MLAAEMDPLIKVGGLADVTGLLPLALKSVNANLDIRIVLPFHAILKRKDLPTDFIGSGKVELRWDQSLFSFTAQ